SFEQLDSVVEGRLVIYKLEKMSPSFAGLTLNALVARIKGSLADENTLDIFENKLIQAKYAYDSVYDEMVFCNMGCEAYVVDDKFPRLKRNQIPRQIVGVKYELSINAIAEAKVQL
ncbi:MAG: PD-(D/E)XK motif protein, partial [Firmicutes bacterium]|nr:PD-(D/E)XK motif protein [Bacillota bacterium]